MKSTSTNTHALLLVILLFVVLFDSCNGANTPNIYTSVTNREWNLAQIKTVQYACEESGCFEFSINLLGSATSCPNATQIGCETQTAFGALHLGSVSTSIIQEIDDKRLRIWYTLGDESQCGAGVARSSAMNLVCSEDANVVSFGVSETDCAYTFNVSVPITFCRAPGDPTQTKYERVCDTSYVSNTNRNWVLKNFKTVESACSQFGCFNFSISPCGSAVSCPNATQAGCETETAFGPLHLGLATSMTVQELNDTALVLSFLDGDSSQCAVGVKRSMSLQLNCGTSQETMRVSEAPSCHYEIVLFVDPAICTVLSSTSTTTMTTTTTATTAAMTTTTGATTSTSTTRIATTTTAGTSTATASVPFSLTSTTITQANSTTTTTGGFVGGPCSSASSPFLCPTGVCVPDESWCQLGCPPRSFKCFNGSCVNNADDCDPPPVLIKPANISVRIPSNYPNPSFDVPVKSTKGSSIAEVKFPQSILKDVGDQILTVTSVPLDVIESANGSGVWGNNSYLGTIASSVLELNIINGASSFSDSVQIAFTNSLPPKVNINKLCLGYIEDGVWKCQSPIYVKDGWLVGNTSHFTPFAILSSSPIFQPHRPMLPDNGDSLFFIYIIAGILLLYAVALVLRCWVMMEMLKKRKSNEVKLKVFQYSQVPFAELDVERPDGMQFKPHASVRSRNIGHFEPREDQQPQQQQQQQQQSEVAADQIVNEKKPEKKPSFISQMLTSHLWFGWADKKRIARCHEKLTTLLLSVLGQVGLAAVFAEDSCKLKIGSIVQHGIIVSLIVFVIALLQLLMFEYAPRRGRKKHIAYTAAILICVTFCLVTIFISSDFKSTQRKISVFVFVTAILFDGLVIQPSKALVIYILSACLSINVRSL